MKVQPSVKPMCEKCIVIKRNGKVIDAVVQQEFVLAKETLAKPCTAVFEECLATDSIEIFVLNSLEELKPIFGKTSFPK